MDCKQEFSMLLEKSQQPKKRCKNCDDEHKQKKKKLKTTVLKERKIIEKVKKISVKKKDLTFVERKNLEAAAHNKCQICKTDDPGGPWDRWSIDHDHLTGKIRGILCVKCNMMLGLAHDNVEVLENAIAYLKSSYDPSI